MSQCHKSQSLNAIAKAAVTEAAGAVAAAAAATAVSLQLVCDQRLIQTCHIQ